MVGAVGTLLDVDQVAVVFGGIEEGVIAEDGGAGAVIELPLGGLDLLYHPGVGLRGVDQIIPYISTRLRTSCSCWARCTKLICGVRYSCNLIYKIYYQYPKFI